MNTALRILTPLLAILVLLPACTTEQPPFTQQELDRFLSDARVVRRLTDGVEEAALAAYGNRARADIGKVVREQAEKTGWDLDRYEYIYGRCLHYARYEYSRREAKKIADALAEARGPGARPDGSSQLVQGLDGRTRALKAAMEETLPVSERVLIHDRLADVMHVVRKTDLMSAM